MHLYINQVAGGPNPNQAVVVESKFPQSFGQTAVSNWVMTDGAGPNAPNVGHAQGLHMEISQTAVSSYYSSMNLVFEDTSRFRGSTLHVMGYIAQDGQWSIVGGTGELTMARGVVEHRIFREDTISRTYELKIHALYAPMNSPTFPGALGCNSWKLGPSEVETAMSA
ncbi:hypothetical protein ACP4OV_010727 [Aristida adscensionis]